MSERKPLKPVVHEYKHRVVIEIITQMPQREEGLKSVISQFLGPWCVKVTPAILNEVVIKETP